MRNEIEIIEQSKDAVNCGGDAHYLKEFKGLKAALSYAIKASLKDKIGCFKVHEITVRSYDKEDELTAVRYFRKGINTFTDTNC